MEFAVLGARPVKYAAAPMLALDLEVTETRGRQVYMLALSIQLMIEPARRAYDEAAHGRLVELFGAPERWAVTTRSLVWSTLDIVVPAFTGRTTVTVPIACHYDLELAAAKYLHSLTGGEAPLALHFNGMVYYPGEDGGLQIVLLPGATRSASACRCGCGTRPSSTTTPAPPGWGCAPRRSRPSSAPSWHAAWPRSTTP